MQRRRLGNTDMNVTSLGYGSMGLRGPATWGVRVVSDADAELFLNRVLDSGINFIDTAPDYGHAEERIGRFLAHRRQEFFLATKCGCDYVQHADHIEIQHQFTPEVIRRNLETSLQRLRTDHVDLLQFHGGDAETLQQNGVIDLLESFRRDGRVRYIGVSTKLPQVDALVDLGVFDTFQLPYSCVEPEHEQVITRAAESGAGIIIRGGIGKGGPQAEIQRDAVNSVWENARLEELLDDGMLPAELILRYTLSHPHCHTTIVGTCNPQHLEANLQAANKGPLPADLTQEIHRRVTKALAQRD